MKITHSVGNKTYYAVQAVAGGSILVAVTYAASYMTNYQFDPWLYVIAFGTGAFFGVLYPPIPATMLG